jgi:hypothetical protein
VIKITLQFKGLFELLQFRTTTQAYGAEIDYHKLLITGYFKEIDIELAKLAYNATISDDKQ